MFLKLAGAGKDGVPFPHSSFFKTLKKFYFILFFYKIPFQFPLLPLQYRSRSPSGRVGVGSDGARRVWSKKVQDVGEGSGFEHHENPAGAAGGRAGGDGRAGPARTHTGAQGEPCGGRPCRGGWDSLGVREVGFSQK